MELNGNIVNARELGGALNRRSSLSGTIQRSSGGGSSDVFWATYGTTTGPELETAYQAGKILMLEYQNHIYYLEDRDPAVYVFHSMMNGQTSGVGITLKQILYISTYNTWAYYEYDALAASQGAANAGKYLAVDNSGNVIPKAAPMAVIPSGSCDSTSTSTAFTATVDGITELKNGVCVWLTNGVVTSAAGCTLNINSLGAKPIYASQSAATAITTQFNISYTALLIYNSTRVTDGCWDYVYGYETNTTYTPVKLGFGYATCSTAEATAAKTATLSSYTLNTGGIVSVKFTNAVGAGATLNINSKGAKAIYHRGSAIPAGVIEAGDTATFIYSTYYHLIAIDKAGGSVTVDSALSTSSTNPVQNKVIKAGLEKIQVQLWVTPGGGWYGFTTIDATGNDVPVCFPNINTNTGLIDPIVLPLATQSAKGAMSASDKTKLDGIDMSAKLNANQGAANAGKFMVVGSDGTVAPVTMTAWQGGNY